LKFGGFTGRSRLLAGATSARLPSGCGGRDFYVFGAQAHANQASWESA
jgi:hypothetical protein